MLVALSISGPAYADGYDNCILAHMGSTQNQTAAYAIERSCVNSASVPIPEDRIGTTGMNVTAWAGQYNLGYGYLQSGMVLQIKNDTEYNITEVKVVLSPIKGGPPTVYTTTDFSAPDAPGVIKTSLGEPGLIGVIKAGSDRKFFVEMNEVALIQDSAYFFKTYTNAAN